MNISANDFVRIRWGLGFLLLAILIGFAVTTTARTLVEKAQTEQRQLEAQQREIRARLSRAPDEERELRDKIALFQQLQERGIIGQEERLNWVDRSPASRPRVACSTSSMKSRPRRPLATRSCRAAPWPAITSSCPAP
jgi:hypothetical protein